MNENFVRAGRGLHIIFLAGILAIVSLVLAVIPVIVLLGGVGAITAIVLTLVGLNTASPTNPSFKTAMAASIINIVVSLVGVLFPAGGFLNILASTANSVLGLAVVYFVCIASTELVEEKGDPTLAQKGRFVWKLTAVCTGCSILFSLVVFIPGLTVMATIASVAAAIVGLVGTVLYLIFLNRAANYLRQ